MVTPWVWLQLCPFFSSRGRAPVMAVARSTAAVRSSDRDLQLKLRVEGKHPAAMLHSLASLSAVLQADDLTAADPNGLADPYCQLKLGTRVHKTGKVFKTLKPKWMQSVVFFSHELQPFATLRGTVGKI